MDGKPLNSVESKRKRKRKISKEQIMVNQEQTKNKKQKIQQNVSGDKMQIPEGGTRKFYKIMLLLLLLLFNLINE